MTTKPLHSNSSPQEIDVAGSQPLEYLDSPKALALQVGSKRTNPDELTQVSDSGE
ncbi:hypothetical protein [Yersinia massiliensis]|uniref:hypothetical protein n=1 Tax=Yersinia massiliensis TaxID=419257 RepID=UPI0002F4CAFF|nr:hypothetical protein [Yersinia massiliensis]MCB5307259.1 hypothetical protein [Yersinia massiliensis]